MSVCPSPKSQKYSWMFPSGSRLLEASNLKFVDFNPEEGLTEKLATGGCPETSISFWTAPVNPPLSVTSSWTVYFPLREYLCVTCFPSPLLLSEKYHL